MFPTILFWIKWALISKKPWYLSLSMLTGVLKFWLLNQMEQNCPPFSVWFSLSSIWRQRKLPKNVVNVYKHNIRGNNEVIKQMNWADLLKSPFPSDLCLFCLQVNNKWIPQSWRGNACPTTLRNVTFPCVRKTLCSLITLINDNYFWCYQMLSFQSEYIYSMYLDTETTKNLKGII